MTTDNATPKRPPSGAAVPGAHPRETKYPRQLVIMATDEMADRIEADAKRAKVSKSEVGRTYIEAGFAAGDAAVAVEAAERMADN